LARSDEGRGISLSTNPRNDLARSIEDLKLAVDVLNEVMTAKVAGSIDTRPTGDVTDPKVSPSLLRIPSDRS